MRTVIQAFTKGQCGSHYLIADVGKVEGLKDIGVHNKRVPAFVLPDRCLQASLLAFWLLCVLLPDRCLQASLLAFWLLCVLRPVIRASTSGQKLSADVHLV